MRSMAKAPRGENPRQNAGTTPREVAKLGTGSGRVASMNFKVSEEFRREFKTYAVQHGKTMLELLQEGFELVKEQHG